MLDKSGWSASFLYYIGTLRPRSSHIQAHESLFHIEVQEDGRPGLGSIKGQKKRGLIDGPI